MKTNFIFIFAVSVLALAYTESEKEKLVRISGECHGAKPITPHKLCMNVKLGVMKENGDIDTNGLEAALSENLRFNSTEIDDIVAHCSEIRGSTPAETAEALDKCMKERLVIYLPGTTFRN